MADERTKLIEQARSLERTRQYARAMDLYLRAGSVLDASRLAASQGKFAEAAKIALSRVGDTTGGRRQLDATQRKAIFAAASYLAKAGDTHQAVDLLVGLGETARAAELLEQSGDFAAAEEVRQGKYVRRSSAPSFASTNTSDNTNKNMEAARRLEAQGKTELAITAYAEQRQFDQAGRLAFQCKQYAQAAHYFTSGGLTYEAAESFVAAGDIRKALDIVVKTARNDANYRRACMLAIRMAGQLNELNFSLENLLGRFIASGPTTPEEEPAFLLLARLYTQHDFTENAKEAYAQLLKRNPQHGEAHAELAQLDKEEQVANRMRAAHVVRDQAAFWGHDEAQGGGVVAPMPGGAALPDLPDLPPVGAVPPAAPQAVPPAAPQAIPPAAPPPGATPIAAPAMAPPPAAPVAAPPAAPGFAPAATSPHAGGGTIAAWKLGQQPPAAPATAAPAAPLPPAPASPQITRAGRSATVASAGGLDLSPQAPLTPAGEASLGAAATQFMDQPQPTPTGPPAQTNEAPRGPMVLEIGTVVADRYKLNQKIGEGGMAAVFRATDMELGEEIALKVFTNPIQSDEMVARFKQELKLTRRLSHPNIIRLFDIGVFHGFRYISMELLEGHPLESIMSKPVDVARGINILVQACSGLQAAHDQGVVHRDVKPENFYITSESVLKVMDFGIAKQQAGPAFTVVGQIAGTPAYMAPEQINNFSDVTSASDIYALGVVAYRMFTGQLPFDHENLMTLLMKHVNEPPVPPRQVHPALPETLEHIILKAMEKGPRQRYASCQDLANALAQVPLV